MSAQHTPGPWLITEGDTVYSLNDDGCNRFSVLVNGGFVVYDNRLLPTSHEELKANARLIAAAPDLLEACLAALDEDSGLMCADAIRAAIARATGGQS